MFTFFRFADLIIVVPANLSEEGFLERLPSILFRAIYIPVEQKHCRSNISMVDTAEVLSMN